MPLEFTREMQEWYDKVKAHLEFDPENPTWPDVIERDNEYDREALKNPRPPTMLETAMDRFRRTGDITFVEAVLNAWNTRADSYKPSEENDG